MAWVRTRWVAPPLVFDLLSQLLVPNRQRKQPCFAASGATRQRGRTSPPYLQHVKSTCDRSKNTPQAGKDTRFGSFHARTRQGCNMPPHVQTSTAVDAGTQVRARTHTGAQQQVCTKRLCHFPRKLESGNAISEAKKEQLAQLLVPRISAVSKL